MPWNVGNNYELGIADRNPEKQHTHAQSHSHAHHRLQWKSMGVETFFRGAHFRRNASSEL